MAPARSKSSRTSGSGGGGGGSGGNNTHNNNHSSPTVITTADSSYILLQDRLHELLSRLSTTVERIKTWPAAGDDASRHIESTGRLIQTIRLVLQSIENIENIVQTNPTTLRARLNHCPVPVDLLDLLDHEGGLNPECFARGLLQEAVGQLEGLKRRKMALESLGDAVQAGLEQKLQEQEEERNTVKDQDDDYYRNNETGTATDTRTTSRKRERESTNEDDDDQGESAAKKSHIDTNN